MLFWFFFLILISLCFSNYRVGEIKRAPYLPVLGIILIILLSAVRFDVGWDYAGYYKSVFPILDQEEMERMEFFHQKVSMLAAYCNYPPLLFVIYSILTYGIVGRVIFKYSSNVYISILVYLAFFYLQTLSVIRQGLALSMVIWAIPYLIKKKYIKYTIIIVVSYFIHSSSIIALSFIPIFIFANKKSCLIIVGGIYFALFSLKIIVEKLLPSYLTYIINAEDFDAGGSLIMYVMLMVVGSVTLMSYKTRDIALIKLSCIALIGCCFPFFLGGHIGGRMASYFYTPLIYTIPLIYNFKPNHYRSLKNLSILFFYLFFALTIVTDSKNPIKSGLSPYETIFTVNLDKPKFK